MFDRDDPRPHARTPSAPVSAALATVAALLAAVAALAAVTLPASAQEAHEHSHEEQEGHAHEGLHFSHPLVAESPTPDTKVRLDYRFFDFPEGSDENSAQVEAEYALTRHFSIEAGIPYTFNASAFGNAEVLLKFSDYAFEEAGVLLGYGVGFSLPTNGSPEDGATSPAPSIQASSSLSRAGGRASSGGGPGVDEPLLSGGGAGVAGSLGTQEWEVEPYLNIGLKSGRWEVVGWGILGVPFHQESQAEVKSEITYQLSTLYHVSDRLQAIVELDGRGGVSGEAVGEDVLNLNPGVKFAPLSGRPFFVGVSAGFPLISGVEEDPFDARIATSLFWHF